ncbi:Cytochrome P450 [Dillenia turbinata]|uniref:Cytochrome P450 n=1 Tax=Dillenia turbinata TaxID=194707 RepID=A0AAN8VGP9_9MAGN
MDFPDYILLLIILALTATLLLFAFCTKSTKPTTHHLRLPPSPPSLPVIGHLHLLSPTLHKSFLNLSNQHGPLLYLRLGSSSCLLVSSASRASEIFKTHDLSFASRPIFAFAGKLPYGNYGFVISPYGEYWKFMKKLCVTELLSPKQVEKSRYIRKEEINKLLKKVCDCAANDLVLDLGGELMKLTNNVTCRVIMRTECSASNDEAERCSELVKESFELAAKLCFGDVLGPLKTLGFWLYGRQAMDVTRRYDEILEKVLQKHEREREAGGEREDKDLMDILLDVYHNDEAEFKITRTHIKAFFLE